LNRFARPPVDLSPWGSFTDVQVDIKSTPEGKEVIFIVVEKRSVKDVVMRGNQKVKLEDIKEN